MALADYAIVSLAEAKYQLAIAQSDATDDTELEGFINDVSAYVEEYTGRKIVVQSVSDEIHDGDGTSRLFPRYFPVTQLSTESSPIDADKLAAVQYRTSPDDSWTNIEDDVDHIFVDVSVPYIELYETVFPAGRRNVKISYKAGFAAGTTLNTIKRVVLEMVQDAWNKHAGGNDILGKSSGSRSEAGQNFTTSYKDLRPEWKDVLDRFRVRRL